MRMKLEENDLAASEEMKTRARRLYLRARNYGLRGLEIRHRGFEKALRADPKQAVEAVQEARMCRCCIGLRFRGRGPSRFPRITPI